jgi:hypothetical protein
MDSIGVDSRWEAFGPFHEYLLDAFPGMYVDISYSLMVLIIVSS